MFIDSRITTVIDAGARQLTDHILGVRCSADFQTSYIGGSMFTEIHNFLLAGEELVLANLD